MRTAAWNCRGLGNDLAVRRLKEIKKKFSPNIIVLMETKQRNDIVKDVCSEVGYDRVVTVPPDGLSGGIALMWKSNVSVSVLYQSPNLVDTYVNINGFGFYLPCVYGHPNQTYQHLVWERLERTATQRTGPWMAIGDFNEIRGNHEKRGGNPRPESSFIDFRKMLPVCDFQDLKHLSDPFSWVGKRHSHDVACCLDRSLVNIEWLTQFPASHMEFLELIESDHRPIITTITSDFEQQHNQFCFDGRVVDRDGFSDAIRGSWNKRFDNHDDTLRARLTECRRAISQWKRRHRSNAQEDIALLKKRIDRAHTDGSSIQRIWALRLQLSKAYADEEEFWQLKSRKTWLASGDRNTKYFFASTKIRKSRNRMHSIFDDDGVEHRGDSNIGKVAQHFFSNLFHNDLTTNNNHYHVLNGFTQRVTSDMNDDLTKRIT